MNAGQRDELLIQKAARQIRRSVGVPPAIRWRYEGTPRMLVESYLYVPPPIQSFPRLPIHTLTCLLDGKTVHNARIFRNAPIEVQEQFATIPNRWVVVPKKVASHWRPGTGSINMATVYVTGVGQDVLESLLHGSQQPILLHDKLLAALVRQLLRTVIDRRAGRPGYVALLVDSFIAHLEWLAGANQAEAHWRSTLSDPAISKALGVIDDHLDEAITIRRLSDSVKMSEPLFRRRFKEVTGRSVHRYIQAQRVQRAREMIEETNLALSAIATYCGFSSQSHMTAVYRRELGITPGVQRRQ